MPALLGVQLEPPLTLLTTRPLVSMPNSSFGTPGRPSGARINVVPSGTHVSPLSVLLESLVYTVVLLLASRLIFPAPGGTVDWIQVAPPSDVRKIEPLPIRNSVPSTAPETGPSNRLGGPGTLAIVGRVPVRRRMPEPPMCGCGAFTTGRSM